MDVDRILVSALKRTASELRQHPGPVREREFEDALLVSYAAEDLPGSITRQTRLSLDGFRGVGNCDVAIATSDQEQPILVELKWGAGTLYNCAWDTVKLSLALAEGAASGAYLVAGAPQTDWDSGQRGSALFDACQWKAEAFMHFYAKEFASWRKEVTARPELLPDRFSLDPLPRIDFDLEGDCWSLRASRISLSGQGLAPVDDNGVVGFV